MDAVDRRAFDHHPARILTLGARVALLLAVAWILYSAFAPPQRPTPQIRYDDVLHAGWGFAVTLVCALAFPRVRWWWIGLSLLASSGLVELAQPYAGRGAEWSDWRANCAGIAAALLPMLVASVRRSWDDDQAQGALLSLDDRLPGKSPIILFWGLLWGALITFALLWMTGVL
jgi:VanZ family protein